MVELKCLSIFTFTLSALFLCLSGCAVNSTDMRPLNVVEEVELARYAGVWYEIARYPNSFQKDCVGSMATYTLRDDGKIDVLNQCYDKSFEGKLRSAKGKAWVADEKSNAKLKVSFFWPFAGDYWIIDLGKDYEYAVIGHPERKYLWVLSRTKEMDIGLYNELVSRLRDVHGYDTDRIIKSVAE